MREAELRVCHALFVRNMKHPMSLTVMDLAAALDSVSPSVKRAFELSHEALRDKGIPHVVVGGLAVNAYGHHYSTKDVDYLVDVADAFDGVDVVVHKYGVPINVGGVDIDYVTAKIDFPVAIKDAMAYAITEARLAPEVVVIVPDWLLVWMKLNAGRSKDIAGVEGLVKSGLDVNSVRAMLRAAGAERVCTSFERCIVNAEADR